MPTLIEAISKVPIDPELLHSKMLSPERRKQLQCEAVIALIRQRPAGARIMFKEFADAARLSSAQHAREFVHVMVRAGLIESYNLGKRSHHYTVCEDIKVTKPKDIVNEATPRSGGSTHYSKVANTGDRTYTVKQLEEHARRFTWFNPSATIPEFILYLEKLR